MGGLGFFLAFLGLVIAYASEGAAQPTISPEDQPLRMPSVGTCELRVIAPTLLEITRVTALLQDSPAPREWNFVKEGRIHLPEPQQLRVHVGSERFAIKRVGFKRRVLYAPFKHWDLRVANNLYLELGQPLAENALVQVSSPDGTLWPANQALQARCDVGSSRVDLQACKLEYSIVSPK